ncbi:hypothetical protein [uncultured Aquimarina sp.]|uniref:hypothetical protein n=1 Tax=uncultured Aquimarina sp. TaxID=575652 RepID=UPI0026312502|nr:hypothetical protein [uncultured Aquimarina sp.]
MKITASERLYWFEKLSVVLTGFSRSELLGTGLTKTYLDTIDTNLDIEHIDALLNSFGHIRIENYDELTTEELGSIQDLVESKSYGSITKLIILLWYTGQWYGKNSYIVSSQSYLEGLVWKAIGAHPMGGKQPGYGTWGFPPLTFSS